MEKQYSMEKIAWRGHVSMFSANAMWGLMSPLAKMVMVGGAVTPLVMTNLRIVGAAVLFWMASLFVPREHVPARDLVRLFGAALLGIVFNQGCFIFGVRLTAPGDASIITTSMPLWAMLLAAVVLKEPITGKKVLGIACGAAGALLLILGGRSAATATAAGNNPLLGDLLVLTAQLSYALYIVLYKNFVKRYSLVTLMKWMFTFSAVCVLPFSWQELSRAQWAALDVRQWLSIAFIVVGATFVGYMLIIVGQKALRPTVAGMYNYIQPIVACLIAIAWGMDAFTWVKAGAVALIFAGVYLVTASKSRREARVEARNLSKQ
jgi:drug/metabolite transporter (DMT)-like permease